LVTLGDILKNVKVWTSEVWALTKASQVQATKTRLKQFLPQVIFLNCSINTGNKKQGDIEKITNKFIYTNHAANKRDTTRAFLSSNKSYLRHRLLEEYKSKRQRFFRLFESVGERNGGNAIRVQMAAGGKELGTLLPSGTGTVRSH
jgi:hypothetical protein